MTVIRFLALPFLAATLLFSAGAANAAPTCQERSGEAIRCGVPGAMPVGWTLPSDQRVITSDPDSMAPAQWFGLFALVGGLFAMIALMPDFDGFGDVEADGEESR